MGLHCPERDPPELLPALKRLSNSSTQCAAAEKNKLAKKAILLKLDEEMCLEWKKKGAQEVERCHRKLFTLRTRTIHT